MATERLTITVEKKTITELELLGEHEYKRARILSMYANKILTDHCDANRDKIQALKIEKASRRK